VKRKPRIAVVSPFLDKSHGTERIVVEWMAQLAEEFDFHVYSQHVEDVDTATIKWHRIPTLPGPHLFNYVWWFLANRIWREWDRRFRGLRHDAVFSPGINCFDADVISVHIVFGEFFRLVQSQLKFARNPVSFWPRLLHRRLYYQLVIFLERHVYKNCANLLILIAHKTAADLARHYGRRDRCVVLYLGLDHSSYNASTRAERRGAAREELGLSDSRFAVLMVGNDWHKKGIRVLLDAMAQLRRFPIDLLVVGRENPAPFQAMVSEAGLDGHVLFLPPRKDVEFYYAAADAYAGPSLEDTFALPPAEAMACGLPVIVSRENGIFEIMQHGQDGLILENPRDAGTLAAMIRQLYDDKELRERLGQKAAETARQYTWERNGRELAAILREIVRRKLGHATQKVVHEL